MPIIFLYGEAGSGGCSWQPKAWPLVLSLSAGSPNIQILLWLLDGYDVQFLISISMTACDFWFLVLIWLLITSSSIVTELIWSRGMCFVFQLLASFCFGEPFFRILVELMWSLEQDLYYKFFQLLCSSWTSEYQYFFNVLGSWMHAYSSIVSYFALIWKNSVHLAEVNFVAAHGYWWSPSYGNLHI